MQKRHGVRGALGLLVGSGIVALTVSSTAATGATHAGATLVDGTGAEIGWVRLTEAGDGRLHVNVKVAGLTAGLHGIHFHGVASCVGPAFTSAGTHHNPLGAAHGLDDPYGAHAGDLPNLTVNIAGRGHLDAVSDRATLTSGPTSLFDANGSAVIIHALEDDQQATSATGNSGARVACGVVIAG